MPTAGAWYGISPFLIYRCCCGYDVSHRDWVSVLYPSIIGAGLDRTPFSEWPRTPGANEEKFERAATPDATYFV